MDFLKTILPAPLVDIFLPIGLVLVAFYLLHTYLMPPLKRKLQESGAWDRIVDRFGGERLREIQFNREIAGLKKSGDLMGAAQLYEEAEWYEQAIETYIEAGEYIAAGTLYEKLEYWEHAAEMYRRAEDWKRAANTLVASGHGEKAAEVYAEHGHKIDAAKLYFDAGRFDRAAELYEAVSYYPQAAQAHEKLGNSLKAAENYENHWAATSSLGGSGLISSPSDRDQKVARMAGQLYEKAGALDKAASIYRRARLSRQAAELAARMGRYDEAGEMLLKDEELEKAAEMFEKAGQRERAAVIRGEVAFRKGEAAKAAQEFLRGGDNLRAAELFESVGDLASAAKCYEQSESLLQAANVYLRAEKKEEAADMFAKGGDALMAAKLYADVGRDAEAAELFEQAGHYFEAGQLANELGDQERAIRLFQQLDPSDENYERATLLLSRLFLNKNMVSLAEEKLQRVLRDRPIGNQTLEHYYYLGLVYEKLGKRDEALETFRKVMAERYGYEDVEEKIAQLSAEAPRPSSSLGAAPSPPAGPPPTAASALAARATAVETNLPPPGSDEHAPSPGPPPLAKAAPSPPFKLIEELGRGFLGGTFKAIDIRNDQPVIIKFLRRELLQDRAVVERFLAEAKIAKTIDHPNLVRLLGLTEIRAHKVVVTEYVDGRSLDSLLSGAKRLSVKQALDLLSTLCVALSYAHQRNLLHKDLKMADVLVARGGKLRLAGFGLGALRTPAAGKDYRYPPPEFLAGRPADARTDIYSLGGMLFHGLTGVHPASPEAAANGAPPTLRRLLPEVPDPLDEIVTRCLAEEPEERFANVAELYAAASELRD
ncbi:MAG TPA: protein kinase [Vicinamibacteria bacterium]|jgi:tetratricopeptide (TPR) repeat protein